MKNDVMNECIENCTECHSQCMEAVAHCLERGGEHVRAVPLLLACADICATSADAMRLGTDVHASLCAACADVCLKCAEACEAMGDDRMKACAETCRECARSCKSMAEM